MDEPDLARPRRRLRGVIAAMLRDERVRFLIVGGLNTAVGFGLFVLFQLTLGRFTSYFVSLYGSYFLATLFAFTAHRVFTFRVHRSGKIVVDFLRFQAVSLVALAVNSFALPLLVELAHLDPIISQALIVIVTTVVSYAGHKFFSFRRSGGGDREVDRVDPPASQDDVRE